MMYKTTNACMLAFGKRVNYKHIKAWVKSNSHLPVDKVMIKTVNRGFEQYIYVNVVLADFSKTTCRFALLRYNKPLTIGSKYINLNIGDRFESFLLNIDRVRKINLI
jgi:hypothetical protein